MLFKQMSSKDAILRPIVYQHIFVNVVLKKLFRFHCL